MATRNWPPRAIAAIGAVWALSALLATAPAPVQAQTPAPGARIIALDAQAWSGSSVNVLAGVRQTLFTDGAHQYAAYYAADGGLTLAKRRLGDTRWETRQTGHKGNVSDAHNHIALVVDGAGYLHLSWDHHNNPLRYARAKAPGSLELEAPRAMLGDQEQSVTYPQFHRLPGGDLVFLYRAGGSGNGQLVMNRYATQTGAWRRVQDRLIDGEGRRSAYWDMTVDPAGRMHLAWNWRETPDVASNHDLAYASSLDGGVSWTGLDGQALRLPLTESSASYALRIPQHSKLMNPPVVAVDAAGRPYISSYWSPAPGAKPRFHVVVGEQQAWRVIAGPEAASDFSLSGVDTKFPPLSRAALLVEQHGKRRSLNLIYRNHEQQIMLSTASIAATASANTSERIGSATSVDHPAWTHRPLTQDSVGAWEPSYDPVQWARLGQAHMLVQTVQQQDGNDRGAARAASPLGVLVWRSAPARVSPARSRR